MIMGRERRSSMEDYERADSYTPPNRSRTRSRSPIHHRASSSQNGHVLGASRSRRSPRRRERFCRTDSRSRQRSHSSEGNKLSKFEESMKLTKPAYGGPKEPLVLDSNIKISVNSKRSTSPVRPTNATRIVTVCPRGERKSQNSNSGDIDRYERGYAELRNNFVRNPSRRNIAEHEENYGKFSRRERERESPSSNRRKLSPSNRRREIRNRSHENRNRRNETHKNSRYDLPERDRLRDRRRNSSRDRRLEKSRGCEGSIRSSRRNGFDEKSGRERNSSKSKRRRYSRDSRQESDDYSHSSRKDSYEESEKSQHEDELEGSENQEDHEDALTPNSGPVALGIRPPLWGPMLPFRPPPIFLPPRPPLIPPMGYVLPPRPRFFPFPRPPPAIYFPPRPLPPPPTY